MLPYLSCLLTPFITHMDDSLSLSLPMMWVVFLQLYLVSGHQLLFLHSFTLAPLFQNNLNPINNFYAWVFLFSILSKLLLMFSCPLYLVTQCRFQNYIISYIPIIIISPLNIPSRPLPLLNSGKTPFSLPTCTEAIRCGYSKPLLHFLNSLCTLLVYHFTWWQMFIASNLYPFFSNRTFSWIYDFPEEKLHFPVSLKVKFGSVGFSCGNFWKHSLKDCRDPTSLPIPSLRSGLDYKCDSRASLQIMIMRALSQEWWAEIRKK